MISLRGPKLKIFAAVLALIALVAGIYMTFFESQGFVKTTATIIDIERNYGSGDNDDTFTPTVEYTVDGKTYTGQLNQSSGSYKVGKTITVMYDPNDPSVVHGDSRMGLYFIGVGAVILAVIAFNKGLSPFITCTLSPKTSFQSRICVDFPVPLAAAKA